MASTATQRTAASHDHSSDAANAQRVTAREWFASGARRPYDPIAKTVLEAAPGEGSSQQVHVFEKVVARQPVGAGTRWLTMLPGYPDGSYGYAQVDRDLGRQPGPRLYIEYLGQGDSDKPKRYRYSSMERADLIQAQWRAHGIRRTMVVSFDYSSLALLELRYEAAQLGPAAIARPGFDDECRTFLSETISSGGWHIWVAEIGGECDSRAGRHCTDGCHSDQSAEQHPLQRSHHDLPPRFHRSAPAVADVTRC